MIESVISGKLYEKGDETLARYFDRVSFVILLSTYAAINILIVRVALH
jgi:hypothetical protein